jgi:membrane-associated phospholipid phosphatase
MERKRFLFMHVPGIASFIGKKQVGSVVIAITCAVSIMAADFPYRLQRSDIAFSLTAAAFFGGGLLLEYTGTPPPELSRNTLDATSINRFDRPATRRWNPGADRLSNYAMGAILIAPAATGIPLLRNRDWPDIATLAVMYGEAVLFTTGLCGAVKVLTLRDRPYLYTTSISDAEFANLAASSDSRHSFYSRHTALAFCSALFLSKTATDIYGPSRLTAAVWGGSLAAATAVGISRYAAGQHFPTDILAGAAVGSLVGYGIPWLHRKKPLHAVTLGFAGDHLTAAWRF